MTFQNLAPSPLPPSVRHALFHAIRLVYDSNDTLCDLELLLATSTSGSDDDDALRRLSHAHAAAKAALDVLDNRIRSANLYRSF